MADDVAMLETEVRELIRRRGLDPARDHEETRVLIADAVADYDERAMLGRVPRLRDPDEAAKALHDAVVGLGPLQKYLDDSEIEEIWINEPGKVFVARMGRAELTTTLLSAGQVRDLVERMLRTSGRRLDLSTPFVDASLPTGERLHAVIPDVTRAHWAVNIRKYVARASRLPDLVTLGSLTQQAAAFLDAAVASGLNVLVSGATQSGKTTMVNALSSTPLSHSHRFCSVCRMIPRDTPTCALCATRRRGPTRPRTACADRVWRAGVVAAREACPVAVACCAVRVPRVAAAVADQDRYLVPRLRR